jgi:murein DD-endopeptidase MepM/ murein hydrolase activator NlpD
MQYTTVAVAASTERGRDGWQAFDSLHVLLASLLALLACAGAAPAPVNAGVKLFASQNSRAYDDPRGAACAPGSGTFAWPLSGLLSQGYWWGHQALDIAAPHGSAVLAADQGQVHFAGWTNTGYGYLIILDHGWGYTTHYAHLSRIYVSVGQTVSRGQRIGAVGSTGNSTGPHLHLEIRYNEVKHDPLAYLSDNADGADWETCLEMR